MENKVWGEKLEEYMRRAVDLSAAAVAKGNHPFGAVLVSPFGNIIAEAENSVVTDRDCTAHAETALMRLASRDHDESFLRQCLLVTSCEPCTMCCGAIFYGGVRAMAFGLSCARIKRLLGMGPQSPSMGFDSAMLFGMGHAGVEVLGPILEDEAIIPHEGFWEKVAKANEWE